MPLMIPRQSVIVHREGARMEPEIGQPFNFTDEEIAQLARSSPDALHAPNSNEARALLEAEKKAAEEREAAIAAAEAEAQKRAEEEAQRLVEEDARKLAAAGGNAPPPSDDDSDDL